MKKSLELAKKLISIPSTEDNPIAIREALITAKKELTGFTCEEFLHNDSPSMLFYNSKTRPEKFKIILNAHLDVVPANPEQFKPLEKNGKLYGRGAYDMKAAAATMIILFKKTATNLPYPLGLQLVTDEETGGFNGTKYQIDQGIKAEFVIAGENTNLKINNQAKGVIWIKLKAKGAPAHGAYPWLGDNALLKLIKTIPNLIANFTATDSDPWKTTINLAKIETTNKTFNKVPEHATAWLDIRFIPEEEKTVLEKIKSILPKEIEIETMISESSQFTQENNPYITKLKKSFEQITHKKPSLLSTNGGSDMRFYEQQGAGSVCFGLTGGKHHSDGEWIEINSLDTYYKILKNFLLID